MVLTKEEKKEKESRRKKEYYKKNKEKESQRQKEYREKNKEKESQRKKIYNKTPNGKKTKTITNWKIRRLVSTDYNLLYDNYLASTNCEECGIEYGKRGDGTGLFKCLDHCHETGLFRNYLCNNCNIRRR